MSTYAAAGVDIDAGNQFARMVRERIDRKWPDAALEIGGFSGRFKVPASTMKGNICADGPGTLAILAALTDRLEVAGIAAAAMSLVDCYVTQGFRPTALVDIIGTEKLDPERHIRIVDGIITACQQADCRLLGGETAELPGLYRHPWMFYVDTVVVGLSDGSVLYEGVRPGQLVYAWPSYGPAANGFSLARKVFGFNDKPSVAKRRLNHRWAELGGATLADALMKEVPVWVNSIEIQRRPGGVRFAGHAHITGGGMVENIPRILPENMMVEIDRSRIERPPIFRLIEEQGKVDRHEMERVFNNGVMIVSIVDPDGPTPSHEAMVEIGRVQQRNGGEPQVQFINNYRA